MLTSFISAELVVPEELDYDSDSSASQSHLGFIRNSTFNDDVTSKTAQEALQGFQSISTIIGKFMMAFVMDHLFRCPFYLSRCRTLGRVQQIFKFVNSLYLTRDSNLITAVCYINFKKLSTVYHVRLVEKLRRIGLDESVVLKC